MNEKKRYLFDVTLVGSGETPEEAWDDAIEGFINDPGDFNTGTDHWELEEAHGYNKT